MGVKDLWSVLSPSCEKKSLWELQGLTIAIDLSSWIVDSQNVGDNTQLNMYLRNLFFRTSYLLLLGVKPIFILEGKAPALKHATIARRQLLQNENKKPSGSQNGNRNRLNSLQKKCEQLLMSMGVPCYKSDGEAEALCSVLNQLGLVDAVISQDSDCFLYGARTVLRNFTMSPAYTCDMYTMANIEERLGLGRHKLLALSLLCGCDYEAGVHGVGKQSALKFLETLTDHEVLDRLRSWRNDNTYESQTVASQMSQEEKVERKIRKMALLDPNFPSEDVISEFMSFQAVELPKFVWLKPSLPNFLMLADRLLVWDEDYIYNKFMPVMTRWHLLHEGMDCGLTLEAIVKKRSVRGVSSYELRWHHDSMGEMTTVEPVNLVTQVYPEIHEAFVKSKEKPKKGATRGRKKKEKQDELDNIENLLGNLSITKKHVKQPNKKRATKKNTKGLQTLDRFLLKETTTNVPCEERREVMCHSTPVKHCTPNQSYHYLSDENVSESPLRKNDKRSNSVESVKQCSLSRCSLNSSSLMDLSAASAAFNLSDIVNSIVTRDSPNPALKIWARNMN